MKRKLASLLILAMLLCSGCQKPIPPEAPPKIDDLISCAVPAGYELISESTAQNSEGVPYRQKVYRNEDFETYIFLLLYAEGSDDLLDGKEKNVVLDKDGKIRTYFKTGNYVFCLYMFNIHGVISEKHRSEYNRFLEEIAHDG